MTYKLYINDEYCCETLCPMPDWEIKRHADVKSAYVTENTEEEKKVMEYDTEKHKFVKAGEVDNECGDT